MDSDRITSIYAEIGKYIIQLESDPASLGPRYLSDIIAQCRNFLNATNLLVLEIHQEKHTVQRELQALEASFDIESSELLANDDRIRRLPNIDDRKATVNVTLRDSLRVIQELRGVLQDLEIIDKAVRFRHRELKDTMSEIRLQRSLVRDDLDTKAFYGDERTYDNAGSNGGKAARKSMDIDELESMLDEAAKDGLAPKPMPGPTAPSDDTAFLDDVIESVEHETSQRPRRRDHERVPVEPNGLLCSVCGSPQFDSPSGAFCENEHGGAPGVEPPPAEPAAGPPSEPTIQDTPEEFDFDAILQNV